MSLPLTLDQVAREIGRSPDWFHHNWKTMIAKAGFPPPLHATRPFVWAPEHIEAWKDRALSSDLKARVAEIRGEAPKADGRNDALEDQRAVLRQHFGLQRA